MMVERATCVRLMVLLITVLLAIPPSLAAESMELPADIHQALDAQAASFAAGQTIAWDAVRSSPLSVSEAKKFLNDKPGNVAVALRGTVHFSFTSQDDLKFLENFTVQSLKPGGKNRPPRNSIDYSFDGTTHFEHTTNAGEDHSLLSATQAELGDSHYHDLDETYFRCFGMMMTTTPYSIARKLPPRTVIQQLLNGGARLAAVDHVKSDKVDLLRVKIEATKKFSATDIAWTICIFPLYGLVDIPTCYFYLDPASHYDLVRSEYFDSTSMMVIRVECSNYNQVDARPLRLPKSCVIDEFAVNYSDPIETETITLKSFSTTPLPAADFTLRDDKPGTYVIQHMTLPDQEIFIVQQNGSLKRQRNK